MTNGLGIPVHQFTNSELGTFNRRRAGQGFLPVAVGFSCMVACESVLGSETTFQAAFPEGFDTPIVAFIAEMGVRCSRQFGEGRLDAVDGKFTWKLLALAPKPGEPRDRQ